MNIRKNIDYSLMFDAMRVAMSADNSQMKLYYELGRLICQRTEKGAAVAAAEYLQRNYPDVPGLSPRNLRRMRDFYRVYEENPELLDLAMEIGWTQNVVILEADLNTEELRWYLCAVRRWGWSKAELQSRIESQAHQEVHINELKAENYTEYRSDENKRLCQKRRTGTEVAHRDWRWRNRWNQQFGLSIYLPQVVRTWNRLLLQTGPPTYKHTNDFTATMLSIVKTYRMFFKNVILKNKIYTIYLSFHCNFVYSRHNRCIELYMC